MVLARDPLVEWQDRYGRPGTAVLDHLRAAVGQGTLDRDALATVAQRLRLPVAAVAGAASFYADLAKARQGRRHVQVCRGTSCFGATSGRHPAEVAQALGVKEGQCTPDGTLSLQGVHCLGLCYASPAALDADVPVVGRDLAAQLSAADRPHPAAPPVPFVSATRPAVVLAGLTGAEGSWQVWPTMVAPGGGERVHGEVATAGLRGRGGAEFPVAAKWRAALAEPAPRYVVANGDEGDPGSYCDRLLLESDPHRVLEGLALSGLAIGARRGYVLVRSEYPAAFERMRAAVVQARQAGHLGAAVHGSEVDFDIEVLRGAGSYVAGEETALLHALQGLRGNVHPRPPYPTTHGFGGHPTAVNNVETLAALPWIMAHGGGAYAEFGHPEETGTKLVCLNEAFRRPGVYEVELGVPLRFLVHDLGGGLASGRRLRALQVGGPLGGFLAPDELDTPLLASALAKAGVALGHGSLVAIDDGVPARDLLRHVWEFVASESCGACAPCRIGSRRGLELVDSNIDPRTRRGQQDQVLDVMATGSLCAFGRGVPGAVRSLQRVYASELA